MARPASSYRAARRNTARKMERQQALLDQRLKRPVRSRIGPLVYIPPKSWKEIRGPRHED